MITRRSLNSRLKAAAELCREGRLAADVGCDHAQLACYLAREKSREVIASDVRDGPLEAARRTVGREGVSNVRVIKSDGLKAIDFAEDVIICGMGGELIAEIISGCRFVSSDTRFILQPMTKSDFLRRWLYENGFAITDERTARDGGRLYAVMLVRYSGERREISGVEALTGLVKDPEYLRNIVKKLRKQAAGMSRSESSEKDAKKLLETALKIEQKAKLFEAENGA